MEVCVRSAYMDCTSSSQHIKLPRSVTVLVEWHCLLTSGTYFLEFGGVSRGRFSSAFWGAPGQGGWECLPQDGDTSRVTASHLMCKSFGARQHPAGCGMLQPGLCWVPRQGCCVQLSLSHGSSWSLLVHYSHEVIKQHFTHTIWAACI